MRNFSWPAPLPGLATCASMLLWRAAGPGDPTGRWGAGARGAVWWGRKPTSKPKVSVRKDEAGETMSRCKNVKERDRETDVILICGL